jgi:hypothetical protein
MPACLRTLAMVLPTGALTTEDFEVWIGLPENADKSFELIVGRFRTLLLTETLLRIK